jgi:hypothetical protein
MNQHGRIRLTFRAHADNSYAELHLPIEEVVGGLVNHMGVHGEGYPRTLEIEGLYAHASDDVVRVTVERVARPDRAVAPPKKPSIAVTRVVNDRDVRGIRGTVTVLENRTSELVVAASRNSKGGWGPPMVTIDSHGLGLFREDIGNFDQAVRSLFEAYAMEFGA